MVKEDGRRRWKKKMEVGEDENGIEKQERKYQREGEKKSKKEHNIAIKQEKKEIENYQEL